MASGLGHRASLGKVTKGIKTLVSLELRWNGSVAGVSDAYDNTIFVVKNRNRRLSLRIPYGQFLSERSEIPADRRSQRKPSSRDFRSIDELDLFDSVLNAKAQRKPRRTPRNGRKSGAVPGFLGWVMPIKKARSTLVGSGLCLPLLGRAGMAEESHSV